MHSDTTTRFLLALLTAALSAGCHGGSGGRRPQAAGFAISPNGGLTTTESGANATFTVALTCAPAADVTIGLGSSDPAEGVPTAASLTFTAANWSTPQVVSVEGVD